MTTVNAIVAPRWMASRIAKSGPTLMTTNPTPLPIEDRAFGVSLVASASDGVDGDVVLVGES